MLWSKNVGGSAAGDDAVPEGSFVIGSRRCSLAYLHLLFLSARSDAERVSRDLSGRPQVLSRRRPSQEQPISVTGERSDIRKLL